MTKAGAEVIGYNLPFLFEWSFPSYLAIFLLSSATDDGYFPPNTSRPTGQIWPLKAIVKSL